MGFAAAWPSAAYELVMESITDWAFSCPISVLFQQKSISLLSGPGWIREREYRTLIILQHVPQMIPSRIMRLAHAHRVVREVDIAVVACCGASISMPIRRFL